MSLTASTSPAITFQPQSIVERILQPVRQRLDAIEVHDRQTAKFLCQLIPSNCPFARDIKLFGRRILHIPPLCKINPLYEQLMSLRFRALVFLADVCKEDVTAYC